MQTLKSSREKDNAQFARHGAPSRFCQRIGSTVFTVNIYFKEDEKEPLESKVYRMMQSDLNNEQLCGSIMMPQAVTGRYRQPEGLLSQSENHEDALPERGSV